MRTVLIAGFLLSMTLPRLPDSPLQDPARDPGRIGQVFDCQGTAWVRPVGRERWSLLRQRTPLAPGDLVRVDARGANALELELDGGRKLVVGPGSLLECTSSAEVRLVSGEMEVATDAAHALVVRGTGDYRASHTGKVVLRAETTRTGTLPEAPRWLTGYRASTTNEWLGALLAKVDGRDVPLHVGYHKVDVVIKDQIAETTIEESFVNSTEVRLEGTFRFPLPADASISGFGMWIGSEYVEADVVEKQRARQIYEDILRRKKDPGLLEWNGGNLFTARVFPIEAHSEKRIKLRYTQVLPLLGDEVRYRYALRSELLRTHPLRQLQIRVHVDSAVAIVEAASPTHPVRARATEHTAVLEYDASEVTPDRDFEAKLRLAQPAGAGFVAHRRGDDGYFMLTFSGERVPRTGLPRELVPDGAPLHVVVVADTSGSIHRKERAAQERFLRALFATLSPKDRFELWSCDLVVQKSAAEPLAVTEENTTRALDWLGKRDSLGWTDLDRAFAEVRKSVAADAVVVYLGDGIGTTKDADPQALAQRILAPAGGTPATCHAVALGTSFEQPVLEAIAALGGGSVRNVGDDAAACAVALLAEIAQPTLKDPKLEFEGVRTARVYPERLPNLPSGGQQIVLGRFLPTGKGQRGRAVVSGTLAGKPVRYATDIAFAEDDEGNAFLPRLWARRHLDALLARGSNKTVQEEIVAFSTEFCIMTPYTSLLVLESDADREQYGVARRVKMRDAERFFAEARDRANLEQMREQMRLARLWRVGVKERALREIAGLGKDLHSTAVAVGSLSSRSNARHQLYLGKAAEGTSVAFDSLSEIAAVPGAPTGGGDGEDDAKDQESLAKEESVAEEADYDDAKLGDKLKAARPSVRAGFAGVEKKVMREESEEVYFGRAKTRRASFDYRRDDRGYLHEDGALNLASLGFPSLPPATPKRQAPPARWDATVLDTLACLERASRIAATTRGLSITVESRTKHALRKHLLARRTESALWGSGGFLVRSEERFGTAHEQWLDASERGVLDRTTGLGRSRKGEATDLAAGPLSQADVDLAEFRAAQEAWTATLVPGADGVVEVKLVARDDATNTVTLRIDRERKVLLARTDSRGGKVTQEVRCSDFVQAAGIWFPTRLEFASEGKPTTWVVRTSVRELGEGELGAALATAKAARADALLIPALDPELAASKEARHAKTATTAQHLRVVCQLANLQLWDEAVAALADARTSSGDRFAMRWIDVRVTALARRAEIAHAQARALVQEIAARGAAGLPLAAALSQHLAGILGSHEELALWQAAKPAFVASGEDQAAAMAAWRSRAASLLEAVGRGSDALALRRENVAGPVQQLEYHFEYVRALLGAHESTAARKHLESLLATPAQYEKYEIDQLYTNWTDAGAGQLAPTELRTICAAWTKANPASTTAWSRLGSTGYFVGDETGVDAWIAEQLALRTLPLDEARRAMLDAAIDLAHGSGWNYWQRACDPRWHVPFRHAALRLLRERDRQAWGAGLRIVGDHRFASTDAYREVLKALREDLARAEFVATAEHEYLAALLRMQSWAPDAVDPELWSKVVKGLRMRLAAATPAQADSARSLLLHVLDGHGESLLALDVEREGFRAAGPEARAGAAESLLQRLARQPWTAAFEDEAFALLPATLGDGLDPVLARQYAGDRLRNFCADLERMRLEALLGPVAEREKLSRAELRTRTAAAKQALAKALAERFARAGSEAKEPWKPWFALERIAFLTAAGATPSEVAAEAKTLWSGIAADATDPGTQVLRARTLLSAFWAATRKNAPATLADDALAITLTGDREHEAVLDWKGYAALLLCALDRTDALIELARGWIVPAKAETRWRVMLAQLLAEKGKLEDAVTTLENARAGDEIDAQTLRSLAAWNLALGDDARRKRAVRRALEVTPEHELQQRIWNDLRRCQPNGTQPGAALDPETLVALEVLLSKASHPGNHVNVVASFYQALKDVRLLESLPDGVLGHTTEGVYGFLHAVGQVLGNVHEEATLDSIRARLAAREKDARTDTDRRALQLLRTMTSRRAAEVLNQPGPHWRDALAALQSAAQGTFAVGERASLANLLVTLAGGKDAAFAKQVVALLVQLADAANTKIERLAIEQALATVHWTTDRKAEAMDLLGGALAEFRRGNEELANAFGAVALLASWHEERGDYGGAERLLQAWAEIVPVARRQEFTERLWSSWCTCLRQRGTCSLGSGTALYAALDARNRAEYASASGDLLNQVDGHFQNLHHTAQDVGLAGVEATILATVRTTLQDHWNRHPTRATNSVRQVADALAHANAFTAAITIVLDRVDTEPRWLTRIEQGTWQNLVWSLADWRAKARLGGPLADRLQKRVLAGFEQDLVLATATNAAFWNLHYQNCWREKRPEFLAVARKVLEIHADSPTRVRYCAEQLWSALDAHEDAIAALVAADQRKPLTYDDRHVLLQWLVAERKFAAALPHADLLIAEVPDNDGHRITKARILFWLGRRDDAAHWIDATKSLCETQKRLGEATLWALGGVSFECELWPRCIEFCRAAIAMHDRAAGRVRGGDSSLASYWSLLGQALVRTGDHDGAVEAAAAAIVLWPDRSDGRRQAIDGLHSTLAAIPDLAAYLARRDAKLGKGDADAPLVRKLCGQIFAQRGELARAREQFLQARELQPEDKDTHDALISVLVRLGDVAAQVEALRLAIATFPSELGYATKLGEALIAAGDAAEAERAFTNGVESQPSEAASHTELAQRREAQRRLPEAIEQWQQVVRIRALDPAGWLSLAKAQLAAGRRPDAKITLDHVLATKWEEHYGDVRRAAAELLPR